jgi:hypothetical protein
VHQEIRDRTTHDATEGFDQTSVGIGWNGMKHAVVYLILLSYVSFQIMLLIWTILLILIWYIFCLILLYGFGSS